MGAWVRAAIIMNIVTSAALAAAGLRHLRGAST